MCFFGLIPLAKLLEYGGEQMSYYLGKDIGDLVRITLTKYVDITYESVPQESDIVQFVVQSKLHLLLCSS